MLKKGDQSHYCQSCHKFVALSLTVQFSFSFNKPTVSYHCFSFSQFPSLGAHSFILLVLSISKNHNKYITMEQQKSRLAAFNSDNTAPDAIPSFLLKTYEILENDKYEDIICWTRNGEGFIVKKVKEFADTILPIFFRHSNYTSFVRQLNMYDFHKTRQENHQNAFKNLMFRRGCKHLLKDIQRKDYKKNKENTKELPAEKNTMEKCREARSQKQCEGPSDGCHLVAQKLKEMNSELQIKALTLASLREMPVKDLEVITLLDVLFDAKKLMRDMLHKMHALTATIPRQRTQQPQLEKQVVWQKGESKWQKGEWATAEGKASTFESIREQKVGGTHSTLFSSFRVA